MSAARARRSAPASASARTAVDGCVPLMSASPSFGRERDGREPGARAARLRPGRARHAVPASRLRRRGRAPGGRAARGRRSRRPIRGSGTRGCTPRFSSASSASSVSRRMPEKPLASTLARSAIVARTARTGSGSPTPAAWLRSRLSCSALERLARDRHVGERAEAGVDAVDRRVAGGLRSTTRAGGAARAPRRRGGRAATLGCDRPRWREVCSSDRGNRPSRRIMGSPIVTLRIRLQPDAAR